MLIIGILAAIAVPKYQMAVEKTRAAEAVLNIKTWGQSIERYYLQHGVYPTADANPPAEDYWALLDIEINKTKNFSPYTYSTIYVALGRTNSSSFRYVISQTMKNQPIQSWAKRGITCHLADLSDTENSKTGKLCKAVCGKSKLEVVWGSGNLGCSID